MSIESEILRIKTNILNAYTHAASKGAIMPNTKNSNNLASTIETITTGSVRDEYSVTVNDENYILNNDNLVVYKDQSYGALLTCNSGYSLNTASIKMNNIDITNSVLRESLSGEHCIVIPKVTGNIDMHITTKSGEVTPTNDQFDVTSIIGYVPINDITTDHVVLLELGDWGQKSGVSENTTIITTRPNNVSTGMGYCCITIPSSGTGFSARDYFDQSGQQTVTPDSSNHTRKMYTVGKDYNMVYWSNNNIFMRGKSTGVIYKNSWTNSSGTIPPFRNALYINVKTDTSANDISSKNIDELQMMYSNREIIPAFNNLGCNIKNFMIFNHCELTLSEDEDTYEWLINHRNEADIDIRMGSDRKIHNFGTSGEIVYVDC